MNQEAIGQRLAAHQTRLRLLIAHLAGKALRAQVDPEDLVQEVFLRAWAAQATLPADEPALGRLLARLARNVVVDAARAARAAKRDGRVQPLERSSWSRAGIDPAAKSAGPATRVRVGEEAARLVRAFESLAPEHRRVLGLRQFQGLSAREAAERMGRSEAAVHSLFRRALLAWTAAARVSLDSPGESDAVLRPLAP